MIKSETEGMNDGTLSMWGMSFTDFRVSRKEAISSSEQRKTDIFKLLKDDTGYVRAEKINFEDMEREF